MEWQQGCVISSKGLAEGNAAVQPGLPPPLQIWNMNATGGMVGVFNLQVRRIGGVGWRQRQCVCNQLGVVVLVRFLSGATSPRSCVHYAQPH